MLVKSNVQSLRGSSQLRHSRQPLGPGGTTADASKNSDKLSTRSRPTKTSMHKMKKILPRGRFSKKILKNINATQVIYVISFTMLFKNLENSSAQF